MKYYIKHTKITITLMKCIFIDLVEKTFFNNSTQVATSLSLEYEIGTTANLTMLSRKLPASFIFISCADGITAELLKGAEKPINYRLTLQGQRIAV